MHGDAHHVHRGAPEHVGCDAVCACDIAQAGGVSRCMNHSCSVRPCCDVSRCFKQCERRDASAILASTHLFKLVGSSEHLFAFAHSAKHSQLERSIPPQHFHILALHAQLRGVVLLRCSQGLAEFAANGRKGCQVRHWRGQLLPQPHHLATDGDFCFIRQFPMFFHHEAIHLRGHASPPAAPARSSLRGFP